MGVRRVRHGKSLFLPASQSSGLKNVRKFIKILSIQKCQKLQFFPIISDISCKKGLIVHNNAELWALMGKNCKTIVLYPKMSTIFSKIVRKHCLRLFPCLISYNNNNNNAQNDNNSNVNNNYYNKGSSI